MLTCAFVTNGTTPRTRRTNPANPRLFIQQWYKPAKNPQWQYSLFVDTSTSLGASTENVPFKGIFEPEPLSSRFVGQFCEFGKKFSGARTVRPLGLHEHIFRSPKKHAMYRFRRFIAQKRALVAHPQRLFVAEIGRASCRGRG